MQRYGYFKGNILDKNKCSKRSFKVLFKKVWFMGVYVAVAGIFKINKDKIVEKL